MSLCIQSLSFERNLRTLFQDLNFKVNEGELMLIQGPNGSGKTTLLRILAGFVDPTRGQLFWNDQLISKNRQQFQNEIHFVGHRTGIKLELTVSENLRLFAALSGLKLCPKKMNKVINQIELEKFSHLKARLLSAGQLRRLSLGRILIQPKAIWLLDEPNTSLDLDGQYLLQRLIQSQLKNRGRVIVATHADIGNPSIVIRL